MRRKLASVSVVELTVVLLIVFIVLVIALGR